MSIGEYLMRNTRVMKAALPIVAGAAMLGGTVAPAASAREAHLCGATTPFVKKFEAFEKSYNRSVSHLGQPKGSSLSALLPYLSKAKKVFRADWQELTALAKTAPKGVSGSFDEIDAKLKKTANDFGAALKDLRSGDLKGLQTHVKGAQKADNGFATALKSLAKQCSS
jgi:hypothetical protein